MFFGTKRLFFMLLGHCALTVALVGVVVPLLPTTPFLILAATCYKRGSDRLNVWLHQHRVLGPPLANWERNGSISTRAKYIAIVTVFIGMGYSIWLVPILWVRFGLVGIGIIVSIYILTRPPPCTIDHTTT